MYTDAPSSYIVPSNIYFHSLDKSIGFARSDFLYIMCTIILLGQFIRILFLYYFIVLYTQSRSFAGGSVVVDRRTT